MTPRPRAAGRAEQLARDDASPEIRALTPAELPAAATLLAEGMNDNPLHVRVFGPDPARRGRLLSQFLAPLVAYIHANGVVLGAYAGNELIAVLGMIAPGRCRPGLRDRLPFARALLFAAPPTVLWRLWRWLAAWARHDSVGRHWHLGPLAVKPAYRRRGVARRLMTRCCWRMDALGAAAWLETDLEINAAFYRTLGFETVRKAPVLGVPTWFMRRNVTTSAAADPARGPGRW